MLSYRSYVTQVEQLVRLLGAGESGELTHDNRVTAALDGEPSRALRTLVASTAVEVIESQEVRSVTWGE